MLETIRWHGAASFALLNGVHVYINPRRVARPERPADLILISSSQYDHCSLADIDKLRGEQTRIIVGPSAAEAVTGEVVVLRPWQSTSAERACVKALPVYRADGRPDESGDVGFVISTHLYDVYYTGRTAALPDTSSTRPDVIILPIGSASEMSAEQTVAALKQMRPRWVVPYGWQGVGRTGRAEVQEFASLLDPSQQVVTLEPNP
ncbi:MAG: MBL fold metallo-hydrolase [Chloroflexi bacterium]|nr:MBL fold metallo-hydrolase [Chloroflexota bacterium]